MLNYILFFTNMFRSPSWPSSGCLTTRIQLIHNNNTKLYYKTTQCNTSFSTTKYGHHTSIYKCACAVLPLAVTCLYFGAKWCNLHILFNQMVAYILSTFLLYLCINELIFPVICATYFMMFAHNSKHAPQFNFVSCIFVRTQQSRNVAVF